MLKVGLLLLLQQEYVLDVILHAPYYIDPDFFENNPNTRLRVRWDGTTVPVESVARDWWSMKAQHIDQQNMLAQIWVELPL